MAKTIEIVERLRNETDGGVMDDSARDAMLEAALTIVALAKALEPFVREAETYAPNIPDMVGKTPTYGAVPLADLRLARSELQKLYGGNNEG